MVKLILSFIFIILLSLVATSASGQSGTIPNQLMYIPRVTAAYHSPVEVLSGDPISYTLEPTEVPWHKTIFSSTQDNESYRYSLRVFENLDITTTQNFQLGIEVYTLHTEKDAIEGYDSLYLAATISQTFPYIADDALYSEIHGENGIYKGILKFRIKNVVWVLECQGYPDVFDKNMLFEVTQSLKERIK